MAPLNLPKRSANAGLFLIFLVLSVVAYSVTGSFPSPLLPGYPGSAIFPRIILAAMAVICIFGLLRVFFAPRRATDGESIVISVVPFLLIAAALLIFALLLAFVGTEVAILVLISVPLWLRTRNILVSGLAGLASVAVVYLLFAQALSVHLPLQFLPRFLF
ncbi:tripartite tricarboxylate transporter TctB family protein [Nitratireductor luteus]|uniref:tripartite tricarboxylate transporter TctB family protein n=1 Tax=Nitratireductor luteus TaxID=2976980 RepID=UPI00223F0DAE|nr:tripartite tricarboxylate transporter TctB family protein [Nitratireductor luteus]